MVSGSATMRGVPDVEGPVKAVDVGGTLDASDAMPSSGVTLQGTSAGRTTVLPRRKSTDANPAALTEQRARFDRVRLLGQGAMGQVELARDNDIRRTVAVKRVHGEAASAAALMRFADEVRIVGQLEHPGIVPIYDVGRDDDGQVYLVMKHLHGETMEDIIAKLRDGKPGYRERFTMDYRVHLFLGVLDAIRYAHARGILHRDLKPANVQIGPYGEVTVMDWGIAKPFRRADGTAAANHSSARWSSRTISDFSKPKWARWRARRSTCRPSKQPDVTTTSMIAAMSTRSACCSTSGLLSIIR